MDKESMQINENTGNAEQNRVAGLQQAITKGIQFEAEYAQGIRVEPKHTEDIQYPPAPVVVEDYLCNDQDCWEKTRHPSTWYPQDFEDDYGCGYGYMMAVKEWEKEHRHNHKGCVS